MIWPLLVETRMPRLPVLDTIFSCRLSISGVTSRGITLKGLSLLSALKIDRLVVPIFLP
ncbi:hypothetical protein GALL_467100 [mine drainage metagenome]|uniref:Uncharacterized protein n=1 Tax=mine drainage metagenome TaxID=410659 RepID=A0A1J5PVU4_9ZZZZ